MNRKQKEHIQYLFLRFMEDKATAEERMELSRLLKESKDDGEWVDLMEEIYSVDSSSADFNEAEWQPMIENLIRINRQLTDEGKSGSKTTFNLLRKIAVAASILLVIGLGGYFLFINRPVKQSEVVKAEPATDVEAPKVTKAMITLADGRTVSIDSITSGMLAQQSNVTVTKTADGKILYQSTGNGQEATVSYNTLTNPRGSKVIDMTLADGSHVWLNAGSSVTYPVAFIGNERKVSITGEAYFEVTHNVAMPFKVSKGEMEVTVLGTHFNVNAYDDEYDIKVTLLEGNVKVSSRIASALLKPGQQARITTDVKVVNAVNLDEVMAWKNGLFQFGEANIDEVMRQISRWYDVEVVYESKPAEHFRGEISRDVEASKVLKMLETTEAVHFRIEGKKVFVKK